MYYETDNLQDLFEIMASCDRLGLFYVIQKDTKEKTKWFGTQMTELIYKLQVVQYTEEGDSNDEILPGGLGECQTTQAAE